MVVVGLLLAHHLRLQRKSQRCELGHVVEGLEGLHYVDRGYVVVKVLKFQQVLSLLQFLVELVEMGDIGLLVLNLDIEIREVALLDYLAEVSIQLAYVVVVAVLRREGQLAVVLLLRNGTLCETRVPHLHTVQKAPAAIRL